MTIHKLTVDISSVDINKILDLRETIKNKSASNRGGWQLEVKSRKFEMVKWILPFLEKVEKSLQSLYPDFKIHRFWFNINAPGNYNDWHNHGNREIVGVVYINTNPNFGDIVFENGKRITPNIGDFIIFPSEINHRVEVNQSNDLRISIAFNFNKRKKSYLEKNL
jgi:hypothetical protein